MSWRIDTALRSTDTVHLPSNGSASVSFDRARMLKVNPGINRTQADSIRNKVRELRRKLQRDNLSPHQRLVATDLLTKCFLRLVEMQDALLRP